MALVDFGEPIEFTSWLHLGQSTAHLKGKIHGPAVESFGYRRKCDVFLYDTVLI